MKLFFDATGALIAAQAIGFRSPTGEPQGAAKVIEFDEATNQAAVDAIQQNSSAVRFANSVVTWQGTPLTINADSAAERDRKQLATIWAVLNDTTTTITQPQLKAILRFIVRQLAPEFRNQ